MHTDSHIMCHATPEIELKVGAEPIKCPKMSRFVDKGDAEKTGRRQEMQQFIHGEWLQKNNRKEESIDVSILFFSS